MNTGIRLLVAVVGTGLIGIGVWDGLENPMPEVTPIDLIQAGAVLLGLTVVPRVSGVRVGPGSKEHFDG